MGCGRSAWWRARRRRSGRRWSDCQLGCWQLDRRGLDQLLVAHVIDADLVVAAGRRVEVLTVRAEANPEIQPLWAVVNECLANFPAGTLHDHQRLGGLAIVADDEGVAVWADRHAIWTIPQADLPPSWRERPAVDIDRWFVRTHQRGCGGHQGGKREQQPSSGKPGAHVCNLPRPRERGRYLDTPRHGFLTDHACPFRRRFQQSTVSKCSRKPTCYLVSTAKACREARTVAPLPLGEVARSA